jgi:hypothetical protein
MKLVVIRWWDAMSDDSGWKSLKKIRRMKPPLVVSVGFVAHKTRDYVTLVASHVGKDCDGDVVIPRGMIKSIRKLKESK